MGLIYYTSCNTCKYDVRDLDEEPCVNCKNNFCPGTEDYETHKLLWEKPDIIDNPVTHPSHYTQGGIECIEAMEAAFGKEVVENFCICNAFKYVWRSKLKNGIQDIDKAMWYLNKYKELIDCE